MSIIKQEREESEDELIARVNMEISAAIGKIDHVMAGVSLPVVAFACLESFARAAATCPPEVVGMVEGQVQEAMDRLRSAWAIEHEGATGVKQ